MTVLQPDDLRCFDSKCRRRHNCARWLERHGGRFWLHTLRPPTGACPQFQNAKEMHRDQ
jgi:hypothetical protein